MSSSLYAESAALDLLEAKISKLECQIYAGNKPETVEEPLIKTLLAVNTMLNATSNSHQNVQSVYKRLPELNTYLTEETLVDPSAEFERKLSILLTLGEDFSAKAKKLEEIVHLQSSLDKQSLHSVSEARPLLSEVLDAYLALNHKINDDDSIRYVVASQQQLIQEVSKSLQATNNELCQLELAKQSK